MAEERPPTAPIALTVAGSDPSGGAGLQADLRTFAAHGVYGMAAVTAVTVQTSGGVRWVEPVNPGLLAQQLDAVIGEARPDAVKIGMLANRDNAEAVARFVSTHRIERVVVDPVIRSSSGADLLSTDGIDVLIAELVPHAYLLTPNLDEAARLIGEPVRTLAEMERAARMLHDRGAKHVMVTGGHLEGDQVVDVLFDGSRIRRISGARVRGPSPHGTGCVLSSAIAARLALGDDVTAAVRRGIDFVRAAIRHAVVLGGEGAGVLGLVQPNTARSTNQ